MTTSEQRYIHLVIFDFVVNDIDPSFEIDDDDDGDNDTVVVVLSDMAVALSS